MEGVGRLPTPLGDLVIAWRGPVLCVADFADSGPRLDRLLARAFRRLPQRGDVPPDLVAAFDRYFGGDCGALDAVPVEPAGSPFQRRVWAALRALPPGAACSYGTLARRLDLSPAAARAVGRANALNPVSLAIPCHRLTGADGTLTGYAGGLWRKEWLLRHEAGFAQPAPTETCSANR